MSLRTALSALVFALFAAASPAAQLGLPQQIVPQPFGVNIHFVQPNESEVDALADIGYRIIRMDFAWGGTERRRGEYDFSGYDKLVESMGKRNIRCLFILDYGNRLYDNGEAPRSDESRAAFAKWAAAAAKHYAGKGIIWELWNEPNLAQFWKPTPSAEDYAKLAHAVIDAVRAADPHAYIIGPATSTFPWAFFDALAERGVLAKFDAISVHPYRQQPPETASNDYNRLRLLLHRASPNKPLPIISGEWGYSTAWGGMTEEKQAQYIVRQWLFNISQDIPISIWYDWKDDGPDPKEPEHHFGSVYRDLKPKPSAIAARALASRGSAHQFVRRLATGNPDDYLLVFSSRGCSALYAWTVGKPHRVLLPPKGLATQLWGWDGNPITAQVESNQLCVDLDNHARYYDFREPLVPTAGWWSPNFAAPVVRAGNATVTVRLTQNLFTTEEGEFRVEADGQVLGSLKTKLKTAEPRELAIPLRFTDRSRATIPATIRLIKDGKADPWQTASITLLIANSLTARLSPARGEANILIDNPSGDAISGKLTVFGDDTQATGELSVKQGAKQSIVRIAADLSKPVRVEATDPAGNILFRIAPTRWAPIKLDPSQSWRSWVEGNKDVAGSAGISISDPPNLPVSEIGQALQLDYRFSKGWKYACIAPPDSLTRIEDKPKELGMWLYGDASGNTLRTRFKDTTGQTFQATFGPIDFTGWKWITIPMNGTEHHWGGANDGVIHYPIRFDAMVLVDGVPLKVDQPLRLYIAAPALRY